MSLPNLRDKPWQFRPTPRRVRDFLYVTLMVSVATVAGYVWGMQWGHGNLTLIFFGSVLFAGFLFGMWPALFAAFLAFMSYNYFFEEPRFELRVSADDIFALSAFLMGGLLVGGLAGRVTDRARALNVALSNLADLFEAGRELSTAVDPARAIGKVLADIAAKDAHGAIWLYQNEVLELAAVSANVSAEEAPRIVSDGALALRGDDLTPQRMVLRMSTGESDVGVAVVWSHEGHALPAIQWLRPLIDLATVAIDRARLIAEIADTHIVLEKEELRAALLSSLSHDLRTPIATILASATSLLEYDAKFDAPTRRDLLTTIQEESERLNRYVANLLAMTRLESGALQVQRALIDPAEAMAAALRQMQRRLSRHQVVRDFGAAPAYVDANPVLVEQALINVIENAAEHAREGSTISVAVRPSVERVVLSVEDEGEGVNAADLPHIFEKFFRGDGDRRANTGVGLGLSVTRGLVEAFGGNVRAVSPARAGRGTRIEIELPAQRALEPKE